MLVDWTLTWCSMWWTLQAHRCLSFLPLIDIRLWYGTGSYIIYIGPHAGPDLSLWHAGLLPRCSDFLVFMLIGDVTVKLGAKHHGHYTGENLTHHFEAAFVLISAPALWFPHSWKVELDDVHGPQLNVCSARPCSARPGPAWPPEQYGHQL